MTQRELILKVNQKDVSDEVITKCHSYKEALKLCKQVSGLTDDQLCQELDIDPAQWSRIWSSKANFPDDKTIQFMTLCGNLVPIRWEAMQFGHGIHRLKSDLEMQVEERDRKIAELESEIQSVARFFQKAGINSVRG